MQQQNGQQLVKFSMDINQPSFCIWEKVEVYVYVLEVWEGSFYSVCRFATGFKMTSILNPFWKTHLHKILRHTPKVSIQSFTSTSLIVISG